MKQARAEGLLARDRRASLRGECETEEQLSDPLVVRYSTPKTGRSIAMTVLLRDKSSVSTRVAVEPGHWDSLDQDQLASAFDRAHLRGRRHPPRSVSKKTIRVVDLFSGCGFMSVGAAAACHRVGVGFEPVLAIDANPAALRVYGINFPGAERLESDITAVLDGALGTGPTRIERDLKERMGSVDLVLGGPPCQGHSDLNNHTRRDDPKNSLYLRMARFAEIVAPSHMIVENVPAVRHDKTGVVRNTVEHLERLGYQVTQLVLDPVEYGVPQRRRRHFLVATTKDVNVNRALSNYQRPPRDVRWAIGDLERIKRSAIVDQAAIPTPEAQRRMAYLFEHDLFDLPNSERPACHRDKDHSYVSVYGRMRYDAPAQTVTTGFYCMGQGRFVHPTQRRTLTAREAARLQFVPDSFRFGDNTTRTALAQMIGNGVPTKLIEILAIELLR